MLLRSYLLRRRDLSCSCSRSRSRGAAKRTTAGALTSLMLVGAVAVGCGKSPAPPPSPVVAPGAVAAKDGSREREAEKAKETAETPANQRPKESAALKQSSPSEAKPAEQQNDDNAQPAAQSAAEEKAAPTESANDPRDQAAERLVLFTPSGPLIVELKLMIDGKPFRAERETLVDDLLELADQNHDGRPTWDEVFADPKRVFSRRLNLSREQMDRKQFMRMHDTNQNGIVDRDEARRFVDRSNNAGQSFTIDSSSRYREANARQSLVRGLLDVDGDELLSATEVAAAESRLRLRDANDDAIVSLAELDDSLAGDTQAMTVMAYANSPAAMRLGPLADWDGVAFTFSELYLRHGELPAAAFPLTPELAGQLDADGDHSLDRDELLRLDAIEPHVVLAVRFGRDGETPPGIDMERVSPELGTPDAIAVRASAGAMLKLGGLWLRFQFIDRLPLGNQAPSADEQLANLDADKNGYLEKKELEEKSPNLAAMFDEWDANGDGMVYAREIAALERGRRAPQATAIRIAVNDDQDALFPRLDADFDGRLTPRELRTAAARLGELDSDGDGKLAIDEIPGGMTVEIERGATMGMPRLSGSVMAAAEPATPKGPKWFVFMDSNRDEEVSLREFPGSREKFSRLDRDNDGFISAAEAAESEQGGEKNEE